MPRGGIRKKINNISRGPRKPCRSVPRGARSPLFYLRHFFAWFLTLVPRSLLLNRTETIATQAVADGESSVALCHGVASGGYGLLVALKKEKRSVSDRESSVTLCHGVALKKRIDRGPREQCRSGPQGGVKKK